MSDAGRYGLLFELSRDAVAEIEMVDRIPVVRAVNPAFVDVFGYDREAIVGNSLNDFIVPEQRRGEATTFDRRTSHGEANWATVPRKTADGIREFLYRGVPFERNGDNYGLAIYTDVTDQRRREQHHQVLHRILRHNLRNDLSRILASTGALRAEIDDAFVTEHVQQIRDAVEDLQEMSTAANRVESVLGPGAESEPVDIASTLSDLLAQYRQRHEAVSFESDLPESLTVTADRRLWTALDALLENAVEHGSAGPGSQTHQDGAEHGTSNPETPLVRVTLSAEDGEAVARIIDDGPGIPDYERAAVFDDRPLSQLSHGSGLGLWLAKWIVESYDGRLAYERRDGETVVSLRVPLTGGDRSPQAGPP